MKLSAHVQRGCHSFEIKATEPAVLQNKTTTNSTSGEVMEYTETYKHWKYYKFEITANHR